MAEISLALALAGAIWLTGATLIRVLDVLESRMTSAPESATRPTQVFVRSPRIMN